VSLAINSELSKKKGCAGSSITGAQLAAEAASEEFILATPSQKSSAKKSPAAKSTIFSPLTSKELADACNQHYSHANTVSAPQTPMTPDATGFLELPIE
jgi:hypothetical protein